MPRVRPTRGPTSTTDLIAVLLATGWLLAGGGASAQSESNPFQARGENARDVSSSNISAPVHSGLDGETLQLERGSSATAPQPPLEAPINANEYICGRGDVFELNFWGAQNFKVRMTADSEGRAFIPKVGYIDVSDKTLAEVRSSVRSSVRRFYPGLNFDLSLSQLRSFSVHIVGFVDRPGIYAATPVERISVLVERAVLASHGSRRRLEIRRRNGQTIHADLWRYDTTGDKQYNPYVMDGDTVTVPFADVVVGISGAAKRTGRVELIGDKTLAELLDAVGGFKPDLTTALPIRVVKRGDKDLNKQQLLPFGAGGSVPAQALHDGDSVFIPTVGELQRSILIIGPVPGATVADEVTTTKRVSFVEGATVRTVLESNGQLGASADLKSSYIKSENGALVPIDLEALLVRRDFSKDRKVDVGDVIIIPQRRLAVAIEGAIFKPGIYPHNLRFTAEQYIAVAGGPSRMAQPRDKYRLISSDGSVRRLEPNALVQPGDTIQLPERNFSRSEIVQLIMGGVGLALSAVSVIILTVRR